MRVHWMYRMRQQQMGTGNLWSIKAYTLLKKVSRKMMMINKHLSCYNAFLKIRRKSLNKYLVPEKRITRIHRQRISKLSHLLIPKKMLKNMMYSKWLKQQMHYITPRINRIANWSTRQRVPSIKKTKSMHQIFNHSNLNNLCLKINLKKSKLKNKS